MLLPYKFQHDIFSDSRVIVLTNKHTLLKQTLLKTIPTLLRCRSTGDKQKKPSPNTNKLATVDNDNDNDEFNKRRTNAIKSYRKKADTHFMQKCKISKN